MGSDEGSESENTKITTVSASALSSFTGRGILPKRAMHFMASYSRKEWTEAKKRRHLPPSGKPGIKQSLKGIKCLKLRKRLNKWEDKCVNIRNENIIGIPRPSGSPSTRHLHNFIFLKEKQDALKKRNCWKGGIQDLASATRPNEVNKLAGSNF